MKNKFQFTYNKAVLNALLIILPAVASAQQVTNPVDNTPVTESSSTPTTLYYPGLANMSTTSSGYNYIRTIIPDVPGTTLPDLNNSIYRQSTDYFDGLGRPLQTVAKKAHADGNDIVNVHVYDFMSREPYQYLPYAAPMSGILSAGTPGNMKLNVSSQMHGFYDQLGPDEQPYSQTIFENSPLGRPIKQLAPGKSWVGSDRGVTYEYKTNSAWSYTSGMNVYALTNVYPHWTIGSGMGNIPQVQGYYDAGALYVTITTDEDGKTSREVKDKAGRVVMKMQQFNSPSGSLLPTDFTFTFYVYDDMGRLRCVIPPEAAKPTMSGPGSPLVWPSLDQQKTDGLCYQYLYDERNRLVEKKIPGKDVEYHIYDKRDRPVMYQDGNLRAQDGGWLVILYDALDRPICSMQYTSINQTRLYLQSLLNDNSTWTPNDALYYMKNYSLYHVYPPALSGMKFLSYTYYDDYAQGGLSGFAYDNSQFSGVTLPNNNTVVASSANASNMTRGLPTGSKVRVIDPDNPNAEIWLTTVNYYDDKGRVIQTQSQNLQGGLDISSNLYFFQGMLYKNILRHQNPNAIAIPGTTDGAITEYRLENTFERSIGLNGGNDEVWMRKQKINTNIDYHLSAYGYDHLGRNVLKQFTAGLNYQNYNMRGFLNTIAFDKYGNTDTLFNENLYYDRGFGSKLYNGNIAGITWCGSDRSKYRAYGYTYDNLNRLNHAEFNQLDGNNAWTKNDGYNYTASNITYDLNGNIKTMDQMVTPLFSNVPFPMDQLTYTYAPASNQLIKVADAVPAGTTLNFDLPDFKDGIDRSTEYMYDNNGNMKRDDNKKISSITYNYLNKPEKITVSNKGVITYVYDAAGNRLQKRITDINNSSNNETWDYTGNFVYKGNELQYILNEEGRARPVAVPVDGTDDQFATKFVYDYFVKDHLGNVRSTVTSTPIDVAYRASHEIVAANTEELVFDHIPQVREIKGGSTSPDNVYAARLNGGEADKRVGTALMLITKPGDKFRLNVNAFYEGDYTQSDESGTEALLESLAGTLMGGTTPSGEVFGETGNAELLQRALANPNLATQLADLTNASNNPDAPKAHLNYLWFNEKMELDTRFSGSFQVAQNVNGTGGWVTIGTGGGNSINPSQNGNSNTNTIPSNGTTAPATGILVVYIDNQSIGKDVWFDDLVVDHYESEVVAEDHYYPFGLTLQTTPTTNNTTPQPYKLTTKELEQKFDLNTYDFGARNFDMTIGRWMSVDPMSEKYFNESQYAYCGNNPISLVDFNGKSYGDPNVTSQMDKDKKLHVTSTSSSSSSRTTTDNGVTTITKTTTTVTATNVVSNSKTEMTEKGDVVTTTNTSTTVIKDGKSTTTNSSASVTQSQQNSSADLTALNKATTYLENFRDQNNMQYNEAVFKQAGNLKLALGGAFAPFPGLPELGIAKFASIGGVKYGADELSNTIQNKILPENTKIALPATVISNESTNFGGRAYRNEPSEGVKKAQQFLYNITFGLFD